MVIGFIRMPDGLGNLVMIGDWLLSIMGVGFMMTILGGFGFPDMFGLRRGLHGVLMAMIIVGHPYYRMYMLVHNLVHGEPPHFTGIIAAAITYTTKTLEEWFNVEGHT